MVSSKLILTKDGSHTIYDPLYNTHYHSIFGAITESRHVFIGNGLEYMIRFKSNIKILEIGFGTGLNAFLSYLTVKNLQINLNYQAIDSHPLEVELAKKLNYPRVLDCDTIAINRFTEMHTCDWNTFYHFDPDFTFIKYKLKLEEFSPLEKYDLIYFDAFDPGVQSELWNLDTFNKLYALLTDKGVLCTYCAKGIVKRTLKAAGFTVEALSGPPGKREMTRAHKINEQ